MTSRSLLPFLLALAIAPGCSSSDDAEVVADACDARAKVDGACPGTTADAITADDLACSARLEANTANELEGKLAGATAGACVVLGKSTFGSINLPAGVHLIGQGPEATKVEGITVAGAATIRGLAVAKGGIVANGGGTVNVDNVLVSGAAGVGISALGTNLSVSRSTIEESGGHGVEGACKGNCTSRITLTMRRTVVRGAHGVGVLGQNVDVSLDGVQIESTQSVNFQYGRGIEVAWGGTLKAKNLAVQKNREVGIFVQEGSADLFNFVSSDNLRGVQLQGIVGGAKLDNFDIVDNTALGLGVTNGSVGIIVQGGRVASTKLHTVPVDVGGVKEVGDGVNWLDSDVRIASSVRIESSARSAVIISATSKGSFEGTLGGGDETRGIIVQGGLEPSLPATLSIAAGVKSSVLTKAQALPVAVAVAAVTKRPL